ncbi:DUF2272 domain-containing protein [Methylopila sp. M107]|uniref:DUF2272 domain-containing protein n=1 Tax=Methylopila sp. M107 TaxID=1101190 RepID=UPI0009DC332A|nr:DUF2272 domain-containing protein [Methylopila sp. M107]
MSDHKKENILKLLDNAAASVAGGETLTLVERVEILSRVVDLLNIESSGSQGVSIEQWRLTDAPEDEPGDEGVSTTLSLGVNEQYRAAILKAEERTGIDGAALAALIDAEAAKNNQSVWKADSKASTSSASGLTQFLDATWLAQATTAGSYLNETARWLGLVSADDKVVGKSKLLKLRFDPEQSIVAAAEYGAANLKILAGKGLLEPGLDDDGKAKLMYLAHHEGPGGAAKFLKNEISESKSASLLKTQVGQAKATALTAAAGSAKKAYRAWLNGYIETKIVPSKYRKAAPGRRPDPEDGGLGHGGAAFGADQSVMRVRSEELNLRSSPVVAPETIKRTLYVGTPLEVLGDSAAPGWKKVRTAAGEEGHVFGAYLRRVESVAKEALLDEAVAQWLRFNRGAGKETVDPYFRYIGAMWQAIGVQGVDGTDTDQYWSAAFISYVVRNTGLYPGFVFAAAHSKYIHDGIKKRVTGVSAPFWGFRLSEHRPQLGDLVCQWREVKQTYDTAAGNSSFKSHTDFVVEVTKETVRTIGGNVSDSVSMKNFDLDANGFLVPENRVFAILRNNL